LPLPQSGSGYVPGRLSDDQVRYCIHTGDGPNDRLRQLKLESVCGGVIFRRQRPQPDVDVAFVEAPRPPVKLPKDDALARKRLAIWHHDQRNDLVAEVASALVQMDAATLWNHGLMLDDGELAVRRRLEDARVAILVESTEHADQLNRRLPHWDVSSHVPGPDGFIEVPYLYTRHIVTETAGHYDGMECTILPRASGGSSPLAVKGFPPDAAVDVDEGERVEGDFQAEPARGYPGCGFRRRRR
jgi:hypothetical protein